MHRFVPMPGLLHCNTCSYSVFCKNTIGTFLTATVANQLSVQDNTQVLRYLFWYLFYCPVHLIAKQGPLPLLCFSLPGSSCPVLVAFQEPKIQLAID